MSRLFITAFNLFRLCLAARVKFLSDKISAIFAICIVRRVVIVSSVFPVLVNVSNSYIARVYWK